MLILYSPKPYVLSTTRDELVCVHRAEFETKDIKVTDLLSQKNRLTGRFNLANVEN